MRGSRQLKKCMAVLLAVAVGVTGITALPQARMEADAMTDKTMDEYDEIVVLILLILPFRITSRM